MKTGGIGVLERNPSHHLQSASKNALGPVMITDQDRRFSLQLQRQAQLPRIPSQARRPFDILGEARRHSGLLLKCGDLGPDEPPDELLLGQRSYRADPLGLGDVCRGLVEAPLLVANDGQVRQTHGSTRRPLERAVDLHAFVRGSRGLEKAKAIHLHRRQGIERLGQPAHVTGGPADRDGISQALPRQPGIASREGVVAAQVQGLGVIGRREIGDPA